MSPFLPSFSTADISIHDLVCVLPDGRLLLDNLNGSFGGEPAALVGPNGVGKTVLAKILAGLLPSSSGTVIRRGNVFYLDQMTNPEEFGTVADLAGVSAILNAVRLAVEGTDSSELELADGNWNIEERLVRELHAAGLGYLTANTPVSTLSGGECTRVSLVGAFLSGADFLILDEPTNHLDAQSKRSLMEYLKTWKGGLLVVSHDRELLEQMGRIVELSQNGLKSYGGNYSFYTAAKAQEKLATLSRLEHAKTERKRASAELRASLERQRHRTAQGRKNKKNQGFPKSLLHAMKGNAEKTTGKLRELKEEKTQALAEAEKEAFMEAEIREPVVLIPPACSVHAAKIVLRMRGVVLPHGSHREAIDWTVTGPERAAVEGPNGSGKTTLLRVLKGEIEASAGSCEVKVPFAFLDQFAGTSDAFMNGERSSVELLRAHGKNLDLGGAGTRLAQIGIAGERLALPAKVLSGGERLKVALLCAIHSEPSPQLLILDEPTNHLDLESVESVEKLLNAYSGALIVVSHDAYFLERIGATRRIRLTGKHERQKQAATT
ncbi:MAG: ATP-binding cassette domain-containing protein [Synergistaceae bacterium]|jgi:ATPase subunit of ABC transporter with duplicated ATPase domains|nr:ATP-binding cassette domain-containing protein [Synergistaceae bacterium]